MVTATDESDTLRHFQTDRRPTMTTTCPAPSCWTLSLAYVQYTSTQLPAREGCSSFADLLQ